MPELTCKCGRPTNTAVCDWEFQDTLISHGCYAAWDDQKNEWVPGCIYDEAAEVIKRLVDQLIKYRGDE